MATHEAEHEVAPDALIPEHFVVGIGASAGGLDAISEVLKAVSPSSGLVLVIVQHLDASHASLLVELLSKTTSLPVQWAVHGRTLKPGNVYIVPPGSAMALRQGVALLETDAHRAGGIDYFFRSLAHDARESSIGVVLSGSGADGSVGLEAIKAVGGLTFAQDERTAAFPQMPRAAIATGCVDRVLPPSALGEELSKVTQSSRDLIDQFAAEDKGYPSPADKFNGIFKILALRTGVDFADYKQSTVKRRLARSMAMARSSNLEEYRKRLQKSGAEVDALYESLLINVTEFFRDPELFEELRKKVLPGIVDEHADNTPIRVWVPGCATGEEAYSIAILFREIIEERSLVIPVQIFATDVSDGAIAVARAGLYTAAEVENLTAGRRDRFFSKTERGYVVEKPIRDMCVFARQNLVADSPFSRLDLISCRNILIYLSPKLQQRLMPIFHYALRPGGALVLGTAESVGGQSELFRLVDRRLRIYARQPGEKRETPGFGMQPSTIDSRPSLKAIPATADIQNDTLDIMREADRVLLSRISPSGVVVNDALNILQFRGDVGHFLAPGEGRASLNLVRMAREGLSSELQSAIEEARRTNARVERTGSVLESRGRSREIAIDVTPIESSRKERFYLVLFSEAVMAAPAQKRSQGARAKKIVLDTQVEQLRRDLESTRRYLQAAIEKHESTNQELRAANEEIQSSNEELQSTNEELETAKEELQSTNEELTTVNEELHSRQVELMQVNNDLNNLIKSVHLPIIILGQDMRIRRFTPMAEKVLNVIPTDIGRPLSDLNLNLNVRELPRLMTEVMESLTVKEVEIQDVAGRWYSMRLRPYKTSDNKIDGVVLTLVDIDELKRTIAQVEQARDLAQAGSGSPRTPRPAT